MTIMPGFVKESYLKLANGLNGFLANVDVLLLLAACSLALGFLLSYYKFQNDTTWFTRCGAVVIFLGLIAAARPHIIMPGSLKPSVIMADTGFELTDKRHWEALGQAPPPPIVEHWRSVHAVYWGLALNLIGTIVWAFGDKLFA